MRAWFTESVRNRVLVAFAGGALAAAFGYAVERWITDDAWRAALGAALDALVVILVGTVVAAILDERASSRAAEVERRRREHAAELERRRRIALESQLLDRLGPSLNLAASGWIHRPGLSAPPDEDLTFEAPLAELEKASSGLGALERELKTLHESEPVMLVYLEAVRKVATLYWFEGGRPIRFRYLGAIRDAFHAASQTELSHTGDRLWGPVANFANALALAETTKLKTDAVVQERLIVASVGELTGYSSMARENAEVSRDLQTVAATNPGDSVLHPAICADVFRRRLDRDPVEMSHLETGWANAVQGTFNRCVGALEHEVANVRVTLLRLIELVRKLTEMTDEDRMNVPALGKELRSPAESTRV